MRFGLRYGPIRGLAARAGNTRSDYWRIMTWVDRDLAMAGDCMYVTLYPLRLPHEP